MNKNTNSLSNKKLTTKLKELYLDLLGNQSPWCILDINNNILLHNKIFITLFDDTNHDYINTPICQTSLTKDSTQFLINEVTYAIKSNIFNSNIIYIETKSKKSTSIWLSIQPITLEMEQLVVLVYMQPIQTPKNITSFIKLQKPTLSYINKNILAENTTSISKECNCKYEKVQSMILNLLIAGFSQREIGERLKLSRTRIAQHIANICHNHGITSGSSKLLKQECRITNALVS